MNFKFWKRKPTVTAEPEITPTPDLASKPADKIEFRVGGACKNYHTEMQSCWTIENLDKHAICKFCGETMHPAVVQLTYRPIWHVNYKHEWKWQFNYFSAELSFHKFITNEKKKVAKKKKTV